MNPIIHSYRARRITGSLAILIFFLVGMLETLSAFAVFQRAGDHAYFLALLNDANPDVLESGVELYDLKAKAVEFIFRAIAAPARWLGAGEIGYLLWLRLLTLAGFLCAFEYVRRSIPTDQSTKNIEAARNRFMLLCLLYPGQLAWTASILRDGPACALLFAAMFAWSLRHRGIAFVCLALSLMLRPEFAIVVTVLVASVYLVTRFQLRTHRILLLLVACALISTVLFEPRYAAIEFSQFAFGDTGSAYPIITNPVDIGGYALVFAQSLVEPMSITDPSSISPFGIAEAVFFVWLVYSGLRRLSLVDTRAAGLFAGLFISMWLFAFFEIYVSGFSRHRLALMFLMIALMSLTEPQRVGRRLRVKKQCTRLARQSQPIEVQKF